MHLFTKSLTGEEDCYHNQVIKDFVFEPQNSMMIHWSQQIMWMIHPTPKTVGNGYSPFRWLCLRRWSVPSEWFSEYKIEKYYPDLMNISYYNIHKLKSKFKQYKFPLITNNSITICNLRRNVYMKATGIVRRIEEYGIRTSRRTRKQVFGGWENLVTPCGRNNNTKVR